MPEKARQTAMSRVGRALVRLCVIGLLARPCVAADPLGPLADTARLHGVAPTAVSALVWAVDDAKPVLSVNPAVPRNPASTLKLLTTFVALDSLGPTHTWRTEVYALGPVRDGVLEGDLLLKGYGDPYLVEENFWKMLGALRRTGIRKITGDLIIDDSYFAPVARQHDAFDGQVFRIYNAAPNAMMVNFGATTFTFVPQPPGQSVTVHVEPALPNLRVSNNLKSASGPCRELAETVDLEVPAATSGPEVILSGHYQARCGEQTLRRTVMSPTDYTYGLFLQLWGQWGGSLNGHVRNGIKPTQMTPWLIWDSPPLAELIRPLNKWSNNLMADALYYALAGVQSEPPLQGSDGAIAIKRYLATHGILAPELILENGSGLSRTTRISAETLHRVLSYAYQSRYMPEYLASLSIPGVDGTLRGRLTQGPEVGWMHMKTGHLDDVAALAGYVHAHNGKTYVAVLLINGEIGGTNALFDTFLQWTYRQ